jgi:NAD(P)-dependent dehydrogenase (short-subunit alcohol dehydrogenase family)
MQELKDRVAVVTGGGSGIGAALARAFAREGMKLVLADLDLTNMQRVAGELRTETLLVRTDVSRLEEVEKLADEAFGHFQHVHVLCNNAGVGYFGSVAGTTHRDWEWVVGVNLWGVIHGVETFVPRLLQQGQPAHVVNTASMAGLIGMQGLAAYTTTKFAVVGLSEALHRELKPLGIGVSVLCPMIVNTNINGSERYRPADLRNPGAPPPPEPSTPPPAPPEGMVGGVIEAHEVAAHVVDAIRSEDLYIITHTASREILRRRCERLDEAAAKVHAKS